MNNKICEAIRTRSIILFLYSGGLRRVEPYVYGRSGNGHEVLRAYQISGASESGQSAQWKLFDVTKINSIAISAGTFSKNRGDYNPQDPIIRTVYCRVGSTE